MADVIAVAVVLGAVGTGVAPDVAPALTLEAVYEGPVYAGTNWWIQRLTTAHGYSGVGAEQRDLPRGMGVYVSDGPQYQDGIWWVYGEGHGWLRADDLGYEQYIPPPPVRPVAAVASPSPAQPRVPGPVSTPVPQPAQTPPQPQQGTSAAEAAIRAYFPENYAWARCVAMKESGLNPAAVSPGGTYVGLFQIDWRLHGHSPEALKDPYVNAQAARKLYNASGTSPWPITRQGC